MSASKDEITVRIAGTDEILDLRHRILRAGLPKSAACFEGDDEPTTIHLVTVSNSTVVGCVTILRRPWNDQPAWQLRGMAVENGWQGRGVGAMLLAEIERIVNASEFSKSLWCNARSPAVGFYERCGWLVASEEFIIETAGPHRKMTRQLT